MTFDQSPTWCSICRREGCTCPYCHDARYVRFNGQAIPCDVCNHREDEPQKQPAPTPIRRRQGRAYADRLDS